MNTNKTNDALFGYAEAQIARISEANRPAVQRLYNQRRNKGRQGSTLFTWASGLCTMDGLARGRPFTGLPPDEWTAIITQLRANLAIKTAIRIVGDLRGVLRAALGTRELPYDLDVALCLEAAEDDEERPSRVLTDAEFQMLLEYVTHWESRYHTPEHIMLKQALLWTLWDSGFRADEVRSINVGDIHWRSDGGAIIKLRSKRDCMADGCRLKNAKSAREIYVAQCAGPLKAWLAIHPRGTDPKAPVFLGWRDRDGTARLAKQMLNQFICRIGERSGIVPLEDRPESVVIPHDFRHTRITRMFREADLNVAQASYYFWGIPNSKQIGRYAHLTGDDTTAMVRRNLGLDDLGYLQHVDAGDDAAALAAILGRIQNRIRSQAPVRGPDAPRP